MSALHKDRGPGFGAASIGVQAIGDRAAELGARGAEIVGDRDRAVLTFAVRTYDVGGEGHALAYDWAPVPGATGAEVRSASLSIYPDVVEESEAGAAFAADASGWTVSVPASRRVRALGLGSFRTADDGSPDVGGANRISVSVAQSGGTWESPRFAAPAVGRQGAIPQSLTGAAYAGGTLTLTPAPATRKLRFALVTGATPAEFNEIPTRLASVRLVTHTSAHDLKVVGPDGGVLWGTPDFDPAAAGVDLDLARPLTAAFDAAVLAGSPLKASVTVSATAPASVGLVIGAARGVIVRSVPGVTAVGLAGLPAPLPLAAPFAAERPSAARADLRLRYAGVRVVPDLSDLRAAPGAPVGLIVGAGGAERALPPEALRGLALARVALRGRVPEPTEVAITVLDASTRTPLGAPAVLALDPGPLAAFWTVLPQPVTVDRPIAIQARANRGRFFWAADVAGNPALAVAVADPDPGGREVRIGDVPLATLWQAEVRITAATLATAPFAGAAPILESDLFVAIELADLRLEYAR